MRTVDRVLAISDAHGENTKLLKLLQKTEYNPETDLLVVVGDMIDRGEENLDILETCEKLHKKGAVLIKGNHEQFAQECIAEMVKNDTWRSQPLDILYNWYTHNGGGNMYDEIKDLSTKKLVEILNFIQSLSLYFSINDYIFAHAGANVDKAIEDNTEDELVWERKSFYYCPAYTDKIIVFGHIPTWLLYSGKAKEKCNHKNARIWYDKMNQDKIGIDCGSCFGGRLAALDLPSYREFYL